MEKIVQFEQKQNYSELAVNKISEELKAFSGGVKEKTVSTFVASTLTHFCQNNERFAEAVYKTKRTLSDCCAEIMDGTGNQVSDIDVYRGAVRHYFPNADISFKMDILIKGENPTDEELSRKPKKKVSTPKKSKNSTQTSNIETNNEKIVNSKANKPKKPKKPKAEKKPEDRIQISIFESLGGE